MVLPEKLQPKAIELAHRGSNPGISGVQGRLRYHFFFNNMQSKVKELMKILGPCNLKENMWPNHTSYSTNKMLGVCGR